MYLKATGTAQENFYFMTQGARVTEEFEQLLEENDLEQELDKISFIYQNVQNWILNKLQQPEGKYDLVGNAMVEEIIYKARLEKIKGEFSVGMIYEQDRFSTIFMSYVIQYDLTHDQMNEGNVIPFIKKLNLAMNDQPICSEISQIWQQFIATGQEYINCKSLYNRLWNEASFEIINKKK